MEDSFFWLLTEQRQAAAVIKQRRRESRQAVVEDGSPAAAAGAASDSVGLPQTKPEAAQTAQANPIDEAAGAAAAVLQAVSCSAADLPLFLRRRGFAEAGLTAAANAALLAVLLPPSSPAAAPACTSRQQAAGVCSAGQPAQLGSSIEQQDNVAGGPAGEAGQEVRVEVATGLAAAEPAVGDRPQAAATVAEADAASGPALLQAAAREAVAVHGLAHVVGRLLEAGADVNHQRLEDGMSPLLAALAGGQLEAAGVLLEAGAQPDAPAGTGTAAAAPETPAGTAAANGGSSSGDTGNKRKRKDVWGGGTTDGAAPAVHAPAVQPTPLVRAVVAGSTALVSRLLAAGADINRQCTMQLAGSAVAVPLTPLIAAVSSCQPAMVAQLLAAGADIHRKCSLGGGSGSEWTSALSSAVLSGSRDMVAQLVAAGACAGRGGAGSPVARDHPALRAVVLAAQRGRADLLGLLYPPLAQALEGGPAAMVAQVRRRTALHPLAAAADRGHLAAVERLQELGAPPDHDRSESGGVLQLTPLMLAAAGGHLAVVEHLLAAGAKALKANSRQETAAVLALRHGQLAVVARLLAHTGEVEAPAAPAGGMPAAQANGAAGGGQPTHVPPQPAPGLGGGSRRAEQLSACSKAWQAGFTASAVPGARPLSLAALDQERQRYQLLLLALLEAHTGCRSLGGRDSSTATATATSAAPAAASRVRQLATPASVAHAAAGSEALLDALLTCGVSISCVDLSDGCFPLMAAAYHGWPPMLRLLRRGADPNQANSSGQTVLMLMATRPRMLETAQQLLAWHAERQREQAQQAQQQAWAQQAQQQAQPPQQAQQGVQQQEQEQEQQQAEQQQQQQQAQQAQQAQQVLAPWALLDLGWRNAEGRDAVGSALAAKNRRCAEAILEHLVAAQQEQQAQQGQQAAAATAPAKGSAATAEASGHVKGAAARAYDLLLELDAKCLADINRPGSGGKHPLISQVLTGSRKQLRQLLALPGLDVNVRDPATGRTALMLAAERQQPAITQELLATGRVDLGATDASGCTALLLSARAGDAVTLRLLLAAGADPSCSDTSGETLLMALARRGQHKLLAELLPPRAEGAPGGSAAPAAAAGAAVNQQDAAGWTALHHAAAVGSWNACKVLRSRGADPLLRTHFEKGLGEGRTALELAEAGGHAACLPLLRPAPGQAQQQAQQAQQQAPEQGAH